MKVSPKEFRIMNKGNKNSICKNKKKWQIKLNWKNKKKLLGALSNTRREFSKAYYLSFRGVPDRLIW